MAYKPVDRSFSQDYLHKQHEAMRWLHEQGITTEEIRTFTLGNIDEDTKAIRIVRTEFDAKYYSGLGKIYVDQWDRELRIPVRGSGHEWFFLKSRFISLYMFTRERPKNWRKRIAAESLYSLSEIRKICAKKSTPVSTNPLTFNREFAIIRGIEENIKS